LAWQKLAATRNDLQGFINFDLEAIWGPSWSLEYNRSYFDEMGYNSVLCGRQAWIFKTEQFFVILHILGAVFSLKFVFGATKNEDQN
jgi:hypothetical protein